MKCAFITGISGYIGSHLARDLLKKGYKVCGLVRQPLHTEYLTAFRNRINLFTYDGSYESVLQAVKASKPDVVYHMATYYAVCHSSDQITEMCRCNLILGNYVLEAMKTCRIENIVYPSTASCHYDNESYNPLNLYAATKQAFSDVMRYYTEACGVRSITLALTDSYGPNDNRPKVLNLIKKAYCEDQSIGLSDGKQIYDVLYIDDIIHALELAGDLLERQKENSSAYQIYSRNPLSLRETVDLLQKTAGARIEVKWGARPQAARSLRGKIRVDPLLPEWQAQISLEEGLKRFWYNSVEL